jgi:hypothetical protein
MKQRRRYNEILYQSISLIVFLFIFCISCVKLNTPAPTNKIELNFPFETSADGWAVGFSDYPAGLSLTDSLSLYQFSYGFSALPDNILPRQSGIKVSGINRSDDLFMYIKKKITGLAPSTYYKITFSVDMASNANSKAVGIGGGPGSSVFLKMGASEKEPLNTIDTMNWYRINIDKGNQSVAGADMINTGNIGVSDTTTVYTLIRRGNGIPLVKRSGPNGELWLIIGTDSGFEGLTTLYYSNVKVTLQL